MLKALKLTSVKSCHKSASKRRRPRRNNSCSVRITERQLLVKSEGPRPDQPPPSPPHPPPRLEVLWTSLKKDVKQPRAWQMLHITRSHASFVSAFYPQNNCSVYVATINIRLHVSYSPPQHTAECSSGAALDLQVALKLTCWEVLMWRDDLLAGNFCCCCWSGAATFSAFQKRSWIMSILSKGIIISSPPLMTQNIYS